MKQHGDKFEITIDVTTDEDSYLEAAQHKFFKEQKDTDGMHHAIGKLPRGYVIWRPLVIAITMMSHPFDAAVQAASSAKQQHGKGMWKHMGRSVYAATRPQFRYHRYSQHCYDGLAITVQWGIAPCRPLRVNDVVCIMRA